MADNKPTLHHLNNSQSQRILWLLEELGIEYNLEAHTRNPPSHPSAPFRSPPSLQSIGSGKAPTLITGAADGNRTITESSAIATYLIRTFDKEDKFGLKNGDWIRDEMLTSVAQTTLSRATFTLLMLDFGLLRNGTGPGGKNYDGPEIRNVCKDLTRELKEGPKGGFFMGEHPGRADIMLEFGLTGIKQRESADLKNEFPELEAWLQRVYERPAWKRAVGKAFDGVYDFTTFPKGPHL
ncbi:hypothetical protein VTL71DRAFT_4361 [Oculimacula yallundae]|uniref:Glutathione S-transferase n=1 Tax=Oculimacula yallundae TaxID=86028 RepID=A0ABR4C2E9_9HELO